MRMNVAGEQCDDHEDGALNGGPFSALCASMRPGEEEREAGDEEVVKKKVFFFSMPQLLFRW